MYDKERLLTRIGFKSIKLRGGQYFVSFVYGDVHFEDRTFLKYQPAKLDISPIFTSFYPGCIIFQSHSIPGQGMVVSTVRVAPKYNTCRYMNSVSYEKIPSLSTMEQVSAHWYPGCLPNSIKMLSINNPYNLLLRILLLRSKDQAPDTKYLYLPFPLL